MHLISCSNFLKTNLSYNHHLTYLALLYLYLLFLPPPSGSLLCLLSFEFLLWKHLYYYLFLNLSVMMKTSRVQNHLHRPCLREGRQQKPLTFPVRLNSPYFSCLPCLVSFRASYIKRYFPRLNILSFISVRFYSKFSINSCLSRIHY